jgi:hypothetical protein
MGSSSAGSVAAGRRGICLRRGVEIGGETRQVGLDHALDERFLAGKMIQQAALADAGFLRGQVEGQMFHAALLNNAAGGVQQGGAGFLSGFWHACGPRLKLYLELQPSGGMNRGRKHCFIWILWHIYTVQTVYKK